MKINWCNILGHRWVQGYLKGEFNGQQIKFIGCYCDRCRKGYSELLKITECAINRKYATYESKYFDEDV